MAVLLHDLNVTATVLAKRLGRSRTDLAHTIRLLDLPDDAIELIDSGALTKGHGKALLSEPNHHRRRLLATQRPRTAGRSEPSRPKSRAGRTHAQSDQRRTLRGALERPGHRTALLAPHGRNPGTGPNGFPVNKTAALAHISARDVGAGWRLTVRGHGNGRQVSLTLDQVRALPQHGSALPIACVEGWSTQNQHWEGVRLIDLAALVGHSADPPGVFVESLQTHGSFREVALRDNQVRDPRSLLALRVNGATLSADHGYPARVIVPGAPGVMNTKWVGRLSFGATTAGGTRMTDRPGRGAARGAFTRRTLAARFRRLYGESPAHLLVLLASFAVCGYAAARLLERNWFEVAKWVVLAAVLHDLVLVPLYAGTDWLLHKALRAPRPAAARAAADDGRAGLDPRVAAVNHLRVPAFLSLLMLLVYWPLITRGPAQLPAGHGADPGRVHGPLAADHRRAVRGVRAVVLPAAVAGPAGRATGAGGGRTTGPAARVTASYGPVTARPADAPARAGGP